MTRVASLISLVALLMALGCSKDPVVLSPAEQLAKDIETIDAYLAAKNITAIKDPSGVRYVVTSQGTGAKPTAYSNVNVNYTGKFLDSEQVFDQSTSPVTFVLYGVIQGWQIALPNVNAGSKVTLYIPSGLAYGSFGTNDGAIPGNANLIFDIELLDRSAQLQKDIATIDKYLDSLKIATVKDASGIRYNITIPGVGAAPTLTNTVLVSYSGRLLSTNAVFQQTSGAINQLLGSLKPPGFQTALLLLPKGTSATVYVPSGLAYGFSASSDNLLPANSNVIYTVQLIDFR